MGLGALRGERQLVFVAMDTFFSSSVSWKLLTGLLIAMCGNAYGQDSCDCPSINECGACQDGLTTLTLKYMGEQTTAVTFRIDDQLVTVFDGMVDPGDTIVINGSSSNGKFVGNKLTIRENDVVRTTLNVSCEPPVYFKSIVADFIVIGGASKTGGGICCDPATVERIPPAISQCPADIQHYLSEGACSAVIDWVEPTASDNCEVLSFTSSHLPGETFSSGTTEVVYTAVDKFGTSSTCTFKVVVNEDIAPTFPSCPVDIITTADQTCQALVTWQPPVAADNCTVASLVASHEPDQAFPPGVTGVTYTATDPSGNTATCAFTVTVIDGSPPVFEICPPDVSVATGTTGEAQVTWIAPIASDPCGEVTLESTHEPGDYFQLGSTEVTYTATDAGGNTANCVFNVNISNVEVDFDFTRILTPDGDGHNDKWIVLNIDRYAENQVTIVDRWGSVIFSGTGYDNENVVWKGQNTTGAIAPTGTYFYAVTLRQASGTVEKRGFIELIRSR